MLALNLETLAQWCVRQKLSYLVQEQAQMVVIPRGPGEAPLRAIHRPERHMLTWLIALPFQVPDAQRAEVARAVTLLNSSSYMGAWVLNQASGELYFRVTVPTHETTWTDDGLMFVVRVVLGTVDALAPSLKAVAAGERAWDAALQADGLKADGLKAD